jgi:hypothetical protein
VNHVHGEPGWSGPRPDGSIRTTFLGRLDPFSGQVFGRRLSDIDITAMDPFEPDNVVYLHPQRRWLTHCLDCDPSGDRVFDVPVHQDVRTGDILTPCPACQGFALVEVPGTNARRSWTARP